MADQNREIVLPPGSYVLLNDATKGVVKNVTGPAVATLTGNDYPVVWNTKTKRFERAQTIEAAVRQSIVAVEGYYIVLTNPARDGRHPSAAALETSPELDVGRKIVVPGPAMFALWPGQDAKVIKGHHLRSNQYLLVRIYNEDAARANWAQAIFKSAVDESKEGEAAKAAAALREVPKDLAVGKTYVIRGTDVAFYMPPTGVTVVADASGNYVRDAITLENLEYCILIDERGTKRYARGPAVVFPEPTERFVKNDKDKVVHRAIELTSLQGLYIKVLLDHADVEDGKPVTRRAGDELFITGATTPIYYPNERHAIVTYDGNTKHFATAIPAGEARYILNRDTGHIRRASGPAMVLPDPRHEVFVRRPLTAKQTELWYPGNAEAAAVNEMLRGLAETAPTTRRGAVSEGEIRRGGTTTFASSAAEAMSVLSASLATSPNTSRGMEKSYGNRDASSAGDEFARGSSYTAPRTISFNTKYDGVPRVDVWTGYSVCVTNAKGERRVEVGPKTLLLDYDETLEVIKLSTSTPKTTDRTTSTVFLRNRNNRVSDVVAAQTSDFVDVNVKLALRVDFEAKADGDSLAWFSVENYVQLLTEHARSILKGKVKGTTFVTFQSNYVDFVRDALLGPKGDDGEREGLFFKENAMRVIDVEVLGVTVGDANVATAFATAQRATITTGLRLEAARREASAFDEEQRIAAQRAKIEAYAAGEIADADKRKEESRAEVQALRLKNREAEVDAQRMLEAVEHQMALATAESEAEVARRRQAVELEKLSAETEAFIARLGAVQPGLIEAMLTASARESVVELARATAMERVMGNKSLPEAVAAVTGGTDITAILRTVTDRAAFAPPGGRTASIRCRRRSRKRNDLPQALVRATSGETKPRAGACGFYFMHHDLLPCRRRTEGVR